jgi:hypothetical protein
MDPLQKLSLSKKSSLFCAFVIVDEVPVVVVSNPPGRREGEHPEELESFSPSQVAS